MMKLSDMPFHIDDLSTDPFWAEKLYTDGELDPKKVAAELCDYAQTWETVGHIIMQQTGGRMTPCYKFYTADAINQCIDDAQEELFSVALRDFVRDNDLDPSLLESSNA